MNVRWADLTGSGVESAHHIEAGRPHRAHETMVA
jgi:hypothetical protein